MGVKGWGENSQVKTLNSEKVSCRNMYILKQMYVCLNVQAMFNAATKGKRSR